MAKIGENTVSRVTDAPDKTSLILSESGVIYAT